MSAILTGIRRDWIVIGLSAAYFLIALAFIDTDKILQSIGASAISLPMVTCVFAVILRGCYHAAQSEARPLSAVVRDIRRLSLSDVLGYVPLCLSMILLAGVFLAWKTNLPAFTWDRTLSDLDHAIHFGTYPWEWLQPVVGYWPITFLIGANYGIWFIVMWAFWIAMAFSKRPQRTRFLVSFSLLWIGLGSFMATAFSSAGPCYFARLGYEPNPYASLLAYLHAANDHAPVFALNIQDMLWSGYIGETPAIGISAMPSLHNAVCLLLVLASAGLHPWIRLALKIHAALIFVGSVHLGWHFAVDSYVSYATALVIWAVVGMVLRRQTRWRFLPRRWSGASRVASG